MSFLGEIKRRKVFQVAAVYAVVAWLLVQVITSISEPLSLPDWADTLVIVLLAVGFPIAVILAWAFDITSEGIQATSGVQGSGVYSQAGGQKLTYLTHGLVILAVGFLVVDQYLLEPRVGSIAVSRGSAVSGQPGVNRFDYELPEGLSFRDTGRRVLALSPDGRHFVYNANDGLYLRTMGELDARLIPGTELDSRSPTFSPDGQSVAYYDNNLAQLMRIGISGGGPVMIGPVASLVYGLSWEADDTILIGQPEGILRVSADGGTPELIIEAEDATQVYGPQLLPDGDTVLFSVGPQGEWDAAQIVVQSLSTGERTVLIEGGNDARYVPTGHLVYALGDGLFAVAFDPNSLTVSGGAAPLAQGVMRAGTITGTAHYSVSRDGTLAYVRASVFIDARTLVWVDREGLEEPINAEPRSYTSPRISPDGTKVALSLRDQEVDIWTWDLVREQLTRLTSDPGVDTHPVWSPDGLRIAFSSTRGREKPFMTSLFWRAANGAGPVERLAGGDGRQLYPTAFLPNATGILLNGADLAAIENDDISIFRLEGEDRATPLLETRFQELDAEVSPDGLWLAYSSNESESVEVYVRPFPDVNAARWQISVGGGTEPLWARSGQELFYRNGEALISVAVETNPSFSAGSPEVVFEGQYAITQGGRAFDVDIDGERFLMMKQVENASMTSQIIIVQNWFEELNRLAPPTE